jgi:hypothetical protein
MKTSTYFRFALFLWFGFDVLHHAQAQAPPLPATDFEISGYELISSRAFSATGFENTYKAHVSNWGTADATVSATLATSSTNATIIDGTLNFGDVPVGETLPSSDTFVVRYDRSNVFNVGDLVWTIDGRALPPTSFGLIEQATAKGLINDETALIYKVYVEFNDDRLPAQYLGRDDGFPEARTLSEAQGQFDTLSPATQQLLAPFLLLPDAPGSWYERRATQQAAQAANAPVSQWVVESTANVNVHWDQGLRPTDGVKAKEFAVELERVWPKLTGLLGVPLSKTNSGMGGPLEVWMVDIATVVKRSGDKEADAVTLYYPSSGPCQDQVPAFMVVTANSDFATLVHEFTHVILSRYKLKTGCFWREYYWMEEATATWAQHYIYPGPPHSEHPYAPSFLSKPEVSLESLANGHQYGAYLWFFYITRGVDSGAHYVRETWDAAANLDSLSAINSVIPGGFKDVWPEFVLYNWNRMVPRGVSFGGAGEPYRYYAKWDQLNEKAAEATNILVNLNGKASAKYTLAHSVPHLAAQYFHYDFTTDSNIRSLTFSNPYADGNEPTAKVQAIVKIRGQNWKPAEDWTKFDRKKLCRDLPSEDFEELVIVISNSEFVTRKGIIQGVDAELEVSNFGCEVWQGTIDHSYEATVPEAKTTTTSTANVVFLYDDAASQGGMGLPQIYTVESGTYSYSKRVDFPFEPPCRTLITASGPIPPNYPNPGVVGPTTGSLIFVPGVLFPAGTGVHYTGQGNSLVQFTETDNCNENHEDITTIIDSDGVSTFLLWWPSVDGEVSADGKTIDGSKDIPEGSETNTRSGHWHWHFTRK